MDRGFLSIERIRKIGPQFRLDLVQKGDDKIIKFKAQTT